MVRCLYRHLRTKHSLFAPATWWKRTEFAFLFYVFIAIFPKIHIQMKCCLWQHFFFYHACGSARVYLVSNRTESPVPFLRARPARGENFHLCAVTPCRLAGNQCPAHLLYGLWLSHSHVLGERSLLGDGGHFAELHSPTPFLLVLVEGKMTICCPSCPVTGQQPSLMAQFHCPLSVRDSRVCVCVETIALPLTCVRGIVCRTSSTRVSRFVFICLCVRVCLCTVNVSVSASRRAKYCEELPVGVPERTHPHPARQSVSVCVHACVCVCVCVA